MSFFAFKPEPVLFLNSVSIGINVVLGQALIMFRLCCSKTDQWDAACVTRVNLTEKVHLEAEASWYGIYSQLCSSIPAILSSLYIAAWSDLHSRKIPLLFTLMGFTLQNLTSLAISTFPSVPLWFMFIGNIAAGIFGHSMVFYACCFAFITDVVRDKNNLTVEVGVASGLIYAGILLGSTLAGEITRWTGFSSNIFVYNYLISVCAMSLAFAYSVIVLRDSIDVRPDQSILKNDAVEEQRSQTSDADINIITDKRVTRTSLSPLNMIEQFFVVYSRPRKGHGRAYLICATICFLVTFACDVGMVGLQYLYLSNEPFNMDSTAYSHLVSIQTGCAACGLFFIPWFFKRVLKTTNDLWLISLGVFITMGKSFLFAMATNYYMILAFCLSCFGAAVLFTGFRSFCSKIVQPSETARLFAFLSSVELLGPLLSAGIFNVLYACTVGFFPSLTWIVAGFILLIVLLCVCWMQYDSNKIPYEIEEYNEASVVDAE